MANPTVEQVIAAASAELGVRESPATSNRVKYNEWFYGRAVSGSAYPWCQAFISWVMAAVGLSPWPKTAATARMRDWARANGTWHTGTAGIRRGDVVRFTYSHSGIVTKVIDASTIETIEGNTSNASSRDGGSVMLRRRARSTVEGYVRPQYGQPTAAPKPAVQTVTVKTRGSNLNIRKSASAAAPVVGKAPNGARVTLVTQGKTWSRIKHGAVSGYVHNDYLTGATTHRTVRVATRGGNLNIRRAASTLAPVVGKAPNGATLTLISQGKTWTKVSHRTVTGYVHNDFVKF